LFRPLCGRNAASGIKRSSRALPVQRLWAGYKPDVRPKWRRVIHPQESRVGLRWCAANAPSGCGRRCQKDESATAVRVAENTDSQRCEYQRSSAIERQVFDFLGRDGLADPEEFSELINGASLDTMTDCVRIAHFENDVDANMVARAVRGFLTHRFLESGHLNDDVVVTRLKERNRIYGRWSRTRSSDFDPVCVSVAITLAPGIRAPVLSVTGASQRAAKLLRDQQPAGMNQHQSNQAFHSDLSKAKPYHWTIEG